MNPTITIPVWQLMVLGTTLMLAFFGFVFAVWKIITSTRDRNASRDIAEAKATADNASTAAMQAMKKADDNEKSILQLRAELPLEYVRRDDWIRSQTVIEAKLDGLAAKLDQGGRCG